jgi:hypothetical protein
MRLRIMLGLAHAAAVTPWARLLVHDAPQAREHGAGAPAGGACVLVVLAHGRISHAASLDDRAVR